MNQEDAIARYMYLHQEKSKHLSHKAAMAVRRKTLGKVIADAQRDRDAATRSEAKSENLICEIEGEMKVLRKLIPEGELKRMFEERRAKAEAQEAVEAHDR